MVSSILGVNIKITGKGDLQHEVDRSLKEANQNVCENSRKEEVEKNGSLENGENFKKAGKDLERHVEVNSNGPSKHDYSLNDAGETVKTNRTEEAVSSKHGNDYGDLQVSSFKGIIDGCQASTTGNSSDRSNTESGKTRDQKTNDGDTSSKSVLDVINGRFGEGGDTILHVASRASRTEIVSMLLESGADPAFK